MPSNIVVTTVLLVRHGERTAPTPANPDPPLTAAGKARAKTLLHVLGQAGIKAIYRSEFLRAKQTAQPLAAQLALTPIEMGNAAAIKHDILSHHVGETVLMIGHSNMVPELIQQLGAGTIPVIDDGEYDNLFVVKIVGSGKGSLTHLKYGKQS